MTDSTDQPGTFVLPPSIVTRVDLSRMVSELERVDNDMTSAGVRARTGGEGLSTPTMSEQLTDFITQNKLDLADGRGRSDLIVRLRRLKDDAPVIHMTFATVADGDSLRQLSAWLRSSIHPQALISVGLQPALIGGVYLRTPNHIKDLSMRARLKGGRELITNELEALRGGR
jgi:hypothetical protein